MRFHLFWYSATGNTKLLARAIKTRLEEKGHEVASTDMFMAVKQADIPSIDCDRAIFAFPVMIFRVPLTVRKFVGMLPARDGGVDAALLLTSGGMGAYTDRRFAALISPKGFRLTLAEEIVCADSYIPFRKWFGLLNRKNNSLPNQDTLSRASDFADKFAVADLPENLTPASGVMRAVFAKVGDGAPEEAGRGFLGKRFMQDNACVACGLCILMCPTGAIAQADRVPSADESKCIGCCACFNTCPKKTWRLRSFTTRYHYVQKDFKPGKPL